MKCAFRPTRLFLCLLATALLWLPACSESTIPSATANNVATSAITAPLLWEVTGFGAHAFLFGTMHVSDPRVTNIHADVNAAFESVDAFYTEAGEPSPEDYSKMATAGMLPEGLSLRKLLPPATWQELDSYLRLRGFGSASDHDKHRPWFVAMSLAQIDAIPLLQEGQALDFALTARAKADGKEIGAIETIEEQLAALTFGNLEEQIHLLEITLQKLREEQATGVSSVQRILELYIAGDTTALWDYAQEETDFDDPIQLGAWEALTTVRNRQMVARIDDKLKSSHGRRYMFAFGSLHFVGPDSVVEGLRALGYQVTRRGAK